MCSSQYKKKVSLASPCGAGWLTLPPCYLFQLTLPPSPILTPYLGWLVSYLYLPFMLLWGLVGHGTQAYRYIAMISSFLSHLA
ncbi:hypothetical protein F5X96DRAFT_636131, partial [Biscogniauxia mediterranea]